MRYSGRRKINFRMVLAALIAVVGIAVLVYPTASNMVFEYQVDGQKQNFLSKTRGNGTTTGSDGLSANPGELPHEDLYQYLLSENQRLYETGQVRLVDAFAYQTIGVNLDDYGIDDGCIGFISIPSISIELPIYLGANNTNMEKGAVHLTETSYPIGGINSNVVIAAHRGQTRNMFRNIDRLQYGDEVIISNFREDLVYKVVESRVIDPTEIGLVKIQPGRDMITLVSCHPVGSVSQRYIVYCERVLP